MNCLHVASSLSDPNPGLHSRERPERDRFVVKRLTLEGEEGYRWDSFIKEHGSIFASASWAALQRHGRDAALFLGVQDDQGLCGACSIINTRRLGNFFSGRFVIQGNPVIRAGLENPGGVVDLLFDAIDREARRRRVLSVEFEDFWTIWPDAAGLRRHGYAVRDIKGWIVDLNGTEAELYRRVASSYRNLKNQAQKKYKIIVQKSDDVETLYRLWQATYERAGKRLSADALAYLKRVHAALAPSGTARIWLATRDGQALSGCFNLYYGDSVYYWHGGSVSGERYGASHLLHWSIIRDARESYRRYHMGGSRLDYENETLRKQGENIDTFKRLWGAQAHDFYWGRKVVRALGQRVFTSLIAPLLHKVRALKG